MVITWAQMHPRSVAVTHMPTGIREHTLAYRSQHTNRDASIARLKSKLAVGPCYPLPMRACYELPDDKPAPNELDEYRKDTQ